MLWLEPGAHLQKCICYNFWFVENCNVRWFTQRHWTTVCQHLAQFALMFSDVSVASVQKNTVFVDRRKPIWNILESDMFVGTFLFATDTSKSRLGRFDPQVHFLTLALVWWTFWILKCNKQGLKPARDHLGTTSGPPRRKSKKVRFEKVPTGSQAPW